MFILTKYFKTILICLIIPLCVVACSATPNEIKQIAITFDDAPRGDSVLSGNERTAMLIDSLEKANVKKAMFFLTTRGINDKTINRINAYQNAGHSIAHHSHQHRWLHKTDLAVYQQDFETAHNIIKNYPNFKAFFRFPYLDEGRSREKTDAMRTFLSEKNYENGYVTVDTYDWHMESLYKAAVKRGDTINMQKLKQLYVNTLTEAVTFYDGVATKYLKRSPKHVLLLHENDLAAYFIDDLVANLRAEGWEIISAEEAFQDPISKVVTKTLFNGQGRVSAIARDLGAEAKNLVSKTEDEKYLEKLFTESGVFYKAK